jgi:hypothetical protein
MISFYTCNPATLARTDEQLSGQPVIRDVQIDQMLTPETYARHRRKYMRLHYQPVIANEKRAPYDYFMMACGPALFRSWIVSPTGLLDFVRADGSFLRAVDGRRAACDRQQSMMWSRLGRLRDTPSPQ